MIPANVARFLLLGAALAPGSSGGWTGAGADAPARPSASVTGHVVVLDKKNKVAPDVAQAVVWLEPVRGTPPAPKPVHAIVTAENKTFTPHVAVVPVGSTVTFPNRDGFDHNVFSLSDPTPFDLGLYERGDGKSVTFPRPGLIRVYCNIHSTMSGFIRVVDTPWFSQPAGDGSFSIAGVPPGEYVLHAWHERALAEDSVAVTVTAAGADLPDVTLDARGFRAQEHMNKYGKPYARTGRRY
jgi:plastocyanin